MPETSQGPGKRPRISRWKLIFAVVLIIAYAAGATYGVLSDASARGLTVKMYAISRSCSSSSSSEQILSYTIGGSIWSSSSLPTSVTHLTFTLSVDGAVIGIATGSDSSFGPGQSATFNLSFTNPTLNPTTLPKSSQLVLDLTATVASGLYSSAESASDNVLQSFENINC